MLSIGSLKFPAGEVHVRLLGAAPDKNIKFGKDPIYHKQNLYCRLKSSDDIMKMLLAAETLRPIDKLTIPYVPYARQDRSTMSGEPCSIKVMAALINSINANSVYILHPHSDVTVALINNVQPLYWFGVPENDSYDVLVCPDAGARKNTMSFAHSKDKPLIFFDKKRDTVTGQLSGFVCHDDIKSVRYLILDDITDGGYTHIKIAEILKERGAKEVYLYAAHGIFSKGLDVYRPNIDHIYTTDSYCELASDEFLTVSEFN